jgi:hypothetical protein
MNLRCVLWVLLSSLLMAGMVSLWCEGTSCAAQCRAKHAVEGWNGSRLPHGTGCIWEQHLSHLTLPLLHQLLGEISGLDPLSSLVTGMWWL